MTGLAPICWEHRWPWLLGTPQVARGAPSRTIRAWIDVPPGLAVEQFKAALSRLISEHEALRTLFRYEDGVPVQDLRASMEPALTAVELGTLHGSEAEGAVKSALPAVIDPSSASALHAVLGVRAGVVELALIAAHWMALDGVSVTLLREQLTDLLRADARQAERRADDTARPSPLELAWEQSTERMLRVNQRSLGYWRIALAEGQRSALPVYWDERFWRAPCLLTGLKSDRLLVRSAAAAEKHATTLPTLWTALLVAAVTGWTGQSSCAVGTVFSNRAGADRALAIGRYSAGARVIVDVDPDRSFTDLVRHTRKRVLAAYARSVHDPGEYVMQQARQSASLGARITSPVEYEYHYYLVDEMDSRPTEDNDLPEVTQCPTEDRVEGIKLDIFPSSRWLRINLKSPAALLPDQAAQSFLRQLAALVDLVAVENPSLAELSGLIDLPVYWDGPEWTSIQQSWVDLGEVERLLRRVPLVDDAAVFPVAAPGGATGESRSLTAFVVPRDTTVEAWQVREHVAGLVSDCPTAVVPGRIVLCRAAPADRGDIGGWEREAFAAESGAAPERPRAPDSAAEKALLDAVQRWHPEIPPRVDSSYAQLHGEFLKIPNILAELESAGYAGLGFWDFMGMASLSRLAAKLTPSSEEE